MNIKTLHLLIKGKVQGVFYRATAKKIAEQLNLTGWIRNTHDEDVEAIVSGEEEQLQKFVEWCRKGPDEAIVEHVVITANNPETFNEFRITR